MKLALLLLLSIPVAKNENIMDTNLVETVDELDMELEQFPKLEQLLPSLSRKTSTDMEHVPGAIVKNVSIDINKINIDKFKKKMDTIIDKLSVHEEPKNETRRQALLPGTQGEEPYINATHQQLKRKTIDCMLQTLYMARHKVKSLEGSKYFNSKDTGFRIAFTYRRLGRIYIKLMQIYSFSDYKRYLWDFPDPQMVLHAKAARLHVDFQYLWWVLIKVDHKYKMKLKDAKKKKKKKQKLEGGVGGNPLDDPNYRDQ